MIKPLHGLRGLAAITVVVGHLSPIHTAAGLGVVLFFVLSGYLIGRLYLGQPFAIQTAAAYVAARVGRVYPLFASVVVGTAFLNILPATNVFSLRFADVLPNLLLFGSNRTIWTISVEFQFYGAFIAVWAVRHLTDRPGPLLIGLLVITTGIAWLLGKPEGERINLASYFPIFVMGLLLSHFLSTKETIVAGASKVLLPVFLVSYLCLAFILYPTAATVYSSPFAIVVCTALVGASVTARDSTTSRLLGSPPMFWLGNISFGTYLLHRHAEWFVRTISGRTEKTWVSFIAMLAITLFVATLARRFLEEPARTRIKAVASNRIGRLFTTASRK